MLSPPGREQSASVVDITDGSQQPEELNRKKQIHCGWAECRDLLSLSQGLGHGATAHKEVGMTRGDPDALPGTRREWGNLLSLQFA